jgi:pimeloyl-ACP methyl ester carboxylesterase
MLVGVLALFLTIVLTPRADAGEGHSLDLGDTRLYFETAGEGVPVVLLHGALQELGDWGPVLTAFADRYHVIALDSRGQGRSSISETELSYGLLAEDVIALLDHVQIERAHIVGLSDGANTALMLAMTRPDRLLSIVCVGANARADEDAVDPRMIERLRNQDLDALAEQMRIKYAHHPNPERIPGFLANMRNMILTQPKWTTEDLGRVSTRTLLMSGDRDYIRQEHTLEMFRALPNASLCIVPSTGHTVPQQKPTLFADIVFDFLEAGNEP